MKRRCDFAHLSVESEYTLLSSIIRISSLIDYSAELRLPAVALVDRDTLSGAVEFVRTMMDRGNSKPVLGLKLSMAPRGFIPGTYRRTRPEMLHLLAKDNEGFANLIRLTTESYAFHGPQVPLIFFEKARQKFSGLILLEGARNSRLHNCFLHGARDEATVWIEELREILGKDLFLALEPAQVMKETEYVRWLVEIASREQLEIVAVATARYIRPEERIHYEILKLIGEGGKITERPFPEEKHKNNTEGPEEFFEPMHLLSEEEMMSIFKELPQAVTNTLKVADRCNVLLEKNNPEIPRFTPPGISPEAYLVMLAEKGLRERYGEPSPVHIERLASELEIINSMKFASYFLLVREIVLRAREMGIPVGPGRGSAASSIVAYSLGITEIDPVRYELLFERFLNPSRSGLPDIDLDFGHLRRGELIKQVVSIYGADRVAQIVSFGTFKARAVIRDVARVFGLSARTTERLLRDFARPGVELSRLEPRLLDSLEPDCRKVIQHAAALEGLPRHISVHAAGVVISERSFDGRVPLFAPEDGINLTQYDMYSLMETGLTKLDFLGVKVLTVISDTLSWINLSTGQELDISKIPLDDPLTYEMLGSGRTLGVFQLEADWASEIVEKAKPRQFEDIMALIALLRPGPLKSGMITRYLQYRRHGEKPESFHPEVDAILEETGGLLLYQEQVMLIARKLAGFSPAEADKLRVAMSKKKSDEMKAMRSRFMEEAVKRGTSRELAGRIFTMMENFAEYGFCKSHTVAYALVSYRTAFLKANYPAEFMAALLTAETGEPGFQSYLVEARRMGLSFLPPDVNRSDAGFIPVPGGLRTGLTVIKGISMETARKIIEERETHGEYRNLRDFVSRETLGALGRKTVEVLIRCGAFDFTGEKRSVMLVTLDKLDREMVMRTDRRTGQGTFFDLTRSMGGTFLEEENINMDIPELPRTRILADERELLGFHITGHPVFAYERLKTALGASDVSTVELQKPAHALLIGEATYIKTFQARGGRMARFVLEDITGTITCIVPPDIYENDGAVLAEGGVLVVYGETGSVEVEPRLSVRKMCRASDVYDNEKMELKVRLMNTPESDRRLQSFRELVRMSPGKVKVMVVIENEGKEITIELKEKVALSEKLLEELFYKFNSERVSLRGPDFRPSRKAGEPCSDF